MYALNAVRQGMLKRRNAMKIIHDQMWDRLEVGKLHVCAKLSRSSERKRDSLEQSSDVRHTRCYSHMSTSYAFIDS